MSLRADPIGPVPEETARVARAAFPRGTAWMRLRDELGTIYRDETFASLFPSRGRPAEAPWRLALVSVMQFAERLSDRRAADAVRGRIDWKYVATALFERIALPSLDEGQRTGAMRFGDPRVMALVGALCITLKAVTGFTNRSLRAQVAGLLGESYDASQMTYDLRRLRRKGLIQRAQRSHTYSLTPDGVRVALFYSKLHARLLRPLIATDHPAQPTDVRNALRVIDHHIIDSIDRARLRPAP